NADTNEDIPGSGLPFVGSFLKKLGDLGIFFPVLKLSNVAKLLVGNDVDLVFVDLPKLDVDKEFNIEFPLFNFGIPYVADVSINAFSGGGFHLIVNFAAGFDTRGLRRGNFLDGFYLGDFKPVNHQISPGGQDRKELTFSADVHAGINASVTLVGLPIGTA